MSRITTLPENTAKWYRIVLLSTLITLTSGKLFAQQLPECNANVPFFNVDLSAFPSGTYITPEIIRNGQCCGDFGNQNYVSFYVTLNSNVAMIEVGILPGYADPGGSGFYNIISGGDLLIPGACGVNIPGGEPACISGIGPHKITYHKPGKNKVKYYINQIPKPTFPLDASTRVGCTLPLAIYGLTSININSINSSTGNTVFGAYNSLLSCTNCSNPVFSPGLTTPAWIDYQICGAQVSLPSCGIFQNCDTVRIFTLPRLDLSASPIPAEFCAGGSIDLTGTASGGDGNYVYTWVDNANNIVSNLNTYTALAQSTYTVQVTDGLASATCPATYVSVPVTVVPPPTASAGIDQTICASNPQVTLSGSVTNATGGIWTGGLGVFNPSSSSLSNVYTPSASELIAGFVTLTLTSTGSGGGCTNQSDQLTIFFSDTVFANPNYAPIPCYGDMTTINAGESGGTAPYTYSWNTGATSSFISASAGSYIVTVTDQFGCSGMGSINVVEPTPLFLSLSSTETSTDITCDGTATVIISGGTGPYTVLWSNLETTLTASNLCWGIVSIDVTDANGCTISGSIVVNKPVCSGFSVNTSNTDLSCNGDMNALAFSSPIGGTPPFTYSWDTSPVQTTQNAVGLGVGTYTVTVTDDIGCIIIETVTISEPSVLTNSMTSSPATTVGGSQGTATANPSGGTPGYTYIWFPSSQTGQTAVGLPAGTYYVVIEDANSCQITDSVIVLEPACDQISISVDPVDISCNGLMDGSAELNIVNGLAPYSISWSSGEIDVTNVSGLAIGFYTVMVTDAENCIVSEPFNIGEPAVLSTSLSPTNISCFQYADGAIDLIVTGGVFPYTYNWTIGVITIAQHQDLVNLGPGTYSVEVADANGCLAVGSAGISQPNQLAASFTDSDVLCNGYNDGSIDATIIGGTLAYNYSWTGPSAFTSSMEDISNLSPGLYELAVTDANGCTLLSALQSYIQEPDSILIVSYNVSCPVPGSDFTMVSIDSLSGGAGEPYQISFDNGVSFLAPGVYSLSVPVNNNYTIVAIDANDCISPIGVNIVVDPKVEIVSVTFDPCVSPGTTNIDITISVQGGDGGLYEISTDGGLTFMAPGSYVITLAVDNSYDLIARDGMGCESMVWSITIPAEFDAEISTLSQISCFGDANGSVDISVSGGANPYLFDWTGPFGFTSSSEDISSLQPGSYDVTITDSNGCILTLSASITEPVVLSSSQIVTNVTCFGGSDGAIDFSVVGGTLPYLFSWDNGSSTEDLSSISAEQYNVQVTDSNGCQISAIATVSQPEELSAQSIVTTATCDNPNGSIQMQITGGVSPYTFAWSNGTTNQDIVNVIGGTYSLVITDANGCNLNFQANVGNTANLSASTIVNSVLCYGDDNGTAVAIVETGTAPYTYSWSNGDSTNSIANLAAGAYSVTITDAFGCQTINNIVVTSPDSLYVILTSPLNTIGFNIGQYGGSDGVVESNVQGGVQPYEYDWSNGSTSSFISNLPAGIYSVIVTDENGCVATATIRLIEPAILEMPEGVSPNGDNDNDYFVVHGLEAYPDNDISIFNRWGNLVFEQRGYDNMWEGGNRRGEPLPDGTYFVILNVNTYGTLTGYIDLRRK